MKENQSNSVIFEIDHRTVKKSFTTMSKHTTSATNSHKHPGLINSDNLREMGKQGFQSGMARGGQV